MSISTRNCQWTGARSAEFAAAEDIHIWKIPLFELQTGDLDILADEELKRSQDFKHETARKVYICSRVAMRNIFSSYLNQPACELKFKTTPQGKPFLASHTTGLKFNLSHSHELILLAVSPSLELGVDLEQHKSIPNWKKIANKVFDSKTIDDLKKEENPETAFLRAWTVFEARQKSLGEGIFGKRTSLTRSTASVMIDIDGFEASLCYFPAREQTVISCFTFTG